MDNYQRNVEKTAVAVRDTWSAAREGRVLTSLVTGTGLGDVIADLSVHHSIPYQSLPHFPVSTVTGHPGRLLMGYFDDVPILVLQGRFHLYEGYSPLEVTFPIRVLQNLGIKNLIITNAAGGLDPRFSPGQVMLIRDHINRFPDLRQQRDLLKSIPGIGDLTAYRLLAELGDMRRFDDVREVVAFVGLNPRQHQSGKKRVTHGISRMGRASLRAALYMPAVVARRCNPRLQHWADQLAQRGLTGKQVIVAVMRKLVHLAYGVLKSGRAFDPHYGKQMPVAA
jgi:hypothetical protein